MDIRRIRDELRMGRSIYDLPLRVTYYARVSTEKVEQQGSLENQIDYYTDFIKKNANWTYVPGYVDEGLSGTSTAKRESFLRMIDDANRERFDFIITKEISRFSRNTLDSIQYTRELLDAGVGVLFQNDNINTLDTDSEFRLVIMAGVAQDEVRKLSERLKFGFGQSIKKGHVLGNNLLWGYDKKDCQLTIVPGQAEAVKLVFELYATGEYGLRKLAQELTRRGHTSLLGNTFNSVTIGHMLTNPKYKGWYCGNKTKCLDFRTKKTQFLDEEEWVMYPDPSIPAIVSEELWNRANSLFKERSNRSKAYGVGYQSRYAYSGKIICEEHGTVFHRQTFRSGEGKQEYWRCRINRERGTEGCAAPSLYTRELNAVLADLFGKLVTNQKEIIKLAMDSLKAGMERIDNSGQIARLEQQKEQLDAKKEKLLELSIAGALSMSEFKERNEKCNRQLQTVNREIDDLLRQETQNNATPAEIKALERALHEELTFSAGISSDVVTSIVDQIIVKKGSSLQGIFLDITLKFDQTVSATMQRNPFVFSITPSKSTTPRPMNKRI